MNTLLFRPVAKKTGCYDPKCFDLAAVFLPKGSPADIDTLASEIQRTIEDFIGDHPEAAE